MKRLVVSVFSFLVAAASFGQVAKDYAVKGIPMASVKITDKFWNARIETNRTVTIPVSFKKCEETGRVENFVLASKPKTGKFKTDYPFDDTDIYKIIEGAAFSMALHPDPALDKYVDSLITIVAKAQEPDGYLYTCRTLDPEHPLNCSGKERWEKERELSHELYNSGHLFEAASAHYFATGKKNFLSIAIKNADLLVKTFGKDKKEVAPGHEIVEMGLVKMYRATGKNEYLSLAKFFIDARGKHPYDKKSKDGWYNGEYWQDQAAVVNQTEAVGHAVRAAYLYSGVADVAALTGDSAYIKAIDKIWENTVFKKIYITGGIGASNEGERFGANYELPNFTAYNETCAAIANVYWNYRMFLLHSDSKYIDVLERSLYNGLLSGVALNGKEFFYPNPLASEGNYKREAWFGCSCCPTNLCRFMPSVGGYIYAQKENKVFVNLFISSQTTIDLGKNKKVEIAQESNYPWEGNIKITVNPKSKSKFALLVRVPCWTQNKPLPSDLYSYLDNSTEKVTIAINGKSVDYKIENGYAVLDREWKKGDVIDVVLPMKVRKVVANSNVKEDRNLVALERGVLVYCAEAVDNNNKVSNLILGDDTQFTASFNPTLLNGVMVLSGDSKAVAVSEDGLSIQTTSQKFRAIPYFAWNNRGAGEMSVFFPRKVKKLKLFAE